MQYFATKQKINPLSREIDCLKELTSYNCTGKETFLCFLKEEDCEYIEDLANVQDKLRKSVEADFDVHIYMSAHEISAENAWHRIVNREVELLFY